MRPLKLPHRIATFRPANRHYRQQLLWALLFAVLVGGGLAIGCHCYLAQLDELAHTDLEAAADRLRHLYQVLVVLGMAGISAVGARLLWLANRTHRHACFPPPEMPVAWGTRELRGRAAEQRSRQLFMLGNSLIGIALIGGFRLLVELSQLL